MAYDPSTDFAALLRQTSGGMRQARMPQLDLMLYTLSAAGLFHMQVGQTAPTANQTTTAWFKPATQSWATQGALFLWNAATAEYEPATPKLFFALLQASA